MKRKVVKRLSIIGILFIVSYVGYLYRYEIMGSYRDKFGWDLPENPRPEGMSTIDWAELNYSKQMKELAKEYDVPYSYLMALVILECGGDKPAGRRFEKHIKKKLEKVKKGTVDRLENVRATHLNNCDDGCLENLATSWGPFQLMGYKAVALDATVAQLRHEEKAAEIGVKWIAKEYGHFLRKKKFKDAFHYHNTGQRFPLSGRPKTHSPYYVSDGLRYMKEFDKREKNNRP